MYVNDLTLDMGERGRRAVAELLRSGRAPAARPSSSASTTPAATAGPSSRPAPSRRPRTRPSGTALPSWRPSLRDEFHLSLGQTGLLLSGSLVGSVVSLIPWGLATDRLGERVVLVSGLGICGAALLGVSQTRSFWVLFALIVLAGLSGASVQSASGRAVLHWFRPQQRGLALGIRQTAIPLSGFAVSLALPALVGSERRRVGLRGARASRCLAGAVVGGLVIREGPSRSSRPRRRSASTPLRDRAIWRLSIGSALVIAPQLCIGGFTVLFLHERRGLSAGAAAAVLAATQVARGRRAGSRRAVVGRPRQPHRATPQLRAGLDGARRARRGSADRAARRASSRRSIAAIVVSMSWNPLSFAATVELAGAGRSGSAIGLQQTVPERAGRRLPGPVRRRSSASSSWTVGFAVVALFPLVGLARAASIARVTRVLDRLDEIYAIGAVPGGLLARGGCGPRSSPPAGCARPGSRSRSTRRATSTAGAAARASGAARTSTASPPRAASTVRSASSRRSRPPSGFRTPSSASSRFAQEETGPVGSRRLVGASGGVPRAAHRAGPGARESRCSRSASSRAIAGQARGDVVFEGRADHAGTTPMDGARRRAC